MPLSNGWRSITFQHKPQNAGYKADRPNDSGALRSSPSDMRAAAVFCGFFSFKSCVGMIAL